MDDLKPPTDPARAVAAMLGKLDESDKDTFNWLIGLARYQPRADAKPAAPVCPKCGGGDVSVSYCVGRGFDHHNHWMAGEKEGVEHLERRCKGCRYWWSEPCIADEPRADVKPDAPAPMGDAATADATEEAIGIVARVCDLPADVVRRRMADSSTTNASPGMWAREIAAALRRRSEPRIGTGAIAETVIHDDANGLIARAERKHNGDVLLSYAYTERTRGRATLIPADAFRALVALMARDGEAGGQCAKCHHLAVEHGAGVIGACQQFMARDGEGSR